MIRPTDLTNRLDWTSKWNLHSSDTSDPWVHLDDDGGDGDGDDDDRGEAGVDSFWFCSGENWTPFDLWTNRTSGKKTGEWSRLRTETAAAAAAAPLRSLTRVYFKKEEF